MVDATVDRRGFFEGLAGDGRPLLMFTGIVLALAGGFCIVSIGDRGIPAAGCGVSGMTARDLCSLDQCRIVHFMFHDRVAFGGSLIALGSLYLWMAEFPLRQRSRGRGGSFSSAGLSALPRFSLSWLRLSGYLARRPTLACCPCMQGESALATGGSGLDGIKGLFRPAVH